MWEHAEPKTVLESKSVEGVQARRHEEAARRSLQLALSIQARRWAHEVRFREVQGLVAERHISRTKQHGFVKALSLDLPVSFFARKLRFSELRDLTPYQSTAILTAGRRLHDDVYNVLPAREHTHQEMKHRLTFAEEVIQDWEDGEGKLRTQDRHD